MVGHGGLGSIFNSQKNVAGFAGHNHRYIFHLRMRDPLVCIYQHGLTNNKKNTCHYTNAEMVCGGVLERGGGGACVPVVTTVPDTVYFFITLGQLSF